LSGIAALLVALALAGCADPVKTAPSSAPPEDSYPYTFENASSYRLYVIPNPDFPNQGWTSFYLGSGEIKTVYLARSESMRTIHFVYGCHDYSAEQIAALVDSERLSDFDWIKFVDRESGGDNADTGGLP
jgi:hypothetical protein